jgi:hypothetical protein
MTNPAHRQEVQEENAQEERNGPYLRAGAICLNQEDHLLRVRLESPVAEESWLVDRREVGKVILPVEEACRLVGVVV